MSKILRAFSLCALLPVTAVGCIELPHNSRGRPDAANAIDSGSTTDARPTDAAIVDAQAVADADPAVCETQRLWNQIADRSIQVGDYCDDIQLCAKNAELAAAVTAIEPGFTCTEAASATGTYRCTWNDPDQLDARDYARLCSISILPEAPEIVSCQLYLEARGARAGRAGQSEASEHAY